MRALKKVIADFSQKHANSRTLEYPAIAPNCDTSKRTPAQIRVRNSRKKLSQFDVKTVMRGPIAASPPKARIRGLRLLRRRDKIGGIRRARRCLTGYSVDRNFCARAA